MPPQDANPTPSFGGFGLRDSEESERRKAFTDVIHHRVRIEGDLTMEQASRIGEISRRCPVRRMLESTPEIVDEFDAVG